MYLPVNITISHVFKGGEKDSASNIQMEEFIK